MIRLEQSVYKDFAHKAEAVLPVIPKTELEAGFSLGVQFVLKKLREDIVVGA